MQKWIILGVIIITIILCVVLFFNFSIETDYIPETEIEDVELRKTIISLYFQNKETKEIQKETRLIDSKNLLQDPYKELIKILIEGPQTEELESIIPKDTKILNTSLQSNCMIIDFSKEFLGMELNEVQKRNMISSIVDTLTELTEVNSIKILIDGIEIEGFSDIGLDFRNEFTRNNVKKEEE